MAKVGSRIDSAIEQDCKGLSGDSPDGPLLKLADMSGFNRDDRAAPVPDVPEFRMSQPRYAKRTTGSASGT